MPQDYYETLGVPKGAASGEIKSAFRNLARQCHPDVNQDPDAEEKFKEINEAYAVLSDKEKRATYDRFGHAGVQGTGGVPDWTTMDFSDILGDLFRLWFRWFWRAIPAFSECPTPWRRSTIPGEL